MSIRKIGYQQVFTPSRLETPFFSFYNKTHRYSFFATSRTSIVHLLSFTMFIWNILGTVNNCNRRWCHTSMGLERTKAGCFTLVEIQSRKNFILLHTIPITMALYRNWAGKYSSRELAGKIEKPWKYFSKLSFFLFQSMKDILALCICHKLE